MNKSDAAELTWATLDAQAIAKLLGRVTIDETGLASRELCLARAHAWALIDGLQAMLAGLPRGWVGESRHGRAPVGDHEGGEG